MLKKTESQSLEWKFYDKLIATDISTTVSDPDIINAVRIATI